jgi:hypothetical protein
VILISALDIEDELFSECHCDSRILQKPIRMATNDLIADALTDKLLDLPSGNHYLIVYSNMVKMCKDICKLHQKADRTSTRCCGPDPDVL